MHPKQQRPDLNRYLEAYGLVYYLIIPLRYLRESTPTLPLTYQHLLPFHLSSEWIVMEIHKLQIALFRFELKTQVPKTCMFAYYTIELYDGRTQIWTETSGTQNRRAAKLPPYTPSLCEENRTPIPGSTAPYTSRCATQRSCWSANYRIWTGDEGIFSPPPSLAWPSSHVIIILKKS